MGNLVDELALRCVLTKEAMSADGSIDDVKVRRMREEFDRSMARETALRHHVHRLQRLAKSESANEPTGIGATLGESASRLLPIPRSMLEMWRLPVIGATALAGRHLFRSHTDPELWSMAKSPIQSMKDYQSHWSKPELPSQTIPMKPARGNRPEIPEVKGYSLGMRGLVGGLAGAAVGSAITGIPHAIAHLIKKRSGGEAAWDTSSHIANAESEAAREAMKREKILANMPVKKIEKTPASDRVDELKKAAQVVSLIRHKVAVAEKEAMQAMVRAYDA